MQEISPDTLSEQLRDGDSGPLVLDIRHREEFEEWHVPDSVNVDVSDELTENPERAEDALFDLPDRPSNFGRVKRTNAGRESVPTDELAELELGPNDCAVE